MVGNNFKRHKFPLHHRCIGWVKSIRSMECIHYSNEIEELNWMRKKQNVADNETIYYSLKYRCEHKEHYRFHWRWSFTNATMLWAAFTVNRLHHITFHNNISKTCIQIQQEQIFFLNFVIDRKKNVDIVKISISFLLKCV